MDSEVIHMDSEVIRATCNLRDASASKNTLYMVIFDVNAKILFSHFKGLLGACL